MPRRSPREKARKCDLLFFPSLLTGGCFLFFWLRRRLRGRVRLFLCLLEKQLRRQGYGLWAARIAVKNRVGQIPDSAIFFTQKVSLFLQAADFGRKVYTVLFQVLPEGRQRCRIREKYRVCDRLAALSRVNGGQVAGTYKAAGSRFLQIEGVYPVSEGVKVVRIYNRLSAQNGRKKKKNKVFHSDVSLNPVQLLPSLHIIAHSPADRLLKFPPAPLLTEDERLTVPDDPRLHSM